MGVLARHQRESQRQSKENTNANSNDKHKGKRNGKRKAKHKGKDQRRSQRGYVEIPSEVADERSPYDVGGTSVRGSPSPSGSGRGWTNP